MKYKKYMDEFLVDKNIVWMQVGFWILLFIAFNSETHALYRSNFAVAVSLMPTWVGLFVGTIKYFNENKK